MRGSGTVNGGRGGGRIQLCATVTSDSIIHSLSTNSWQYNDLEGKH